MTLNDADADPDRIHTRRALRAALPGRPARGRETREYLGARGAKFMIFPGSPLAKKPPRWVMAAELVETSRLLARTVARIQPEWIEPLAGHLVKRTYSEPHWSRKRAAAVATERVTLHGIPIVVGRTVDLRPDRPRAGPRAVHPARARRGRLGHPAPVLPRQPGAARGRRGAGAPRAAARPRRRRGDALRVLRRAASRPTSSPAGTSTRWWKKDPRRQPGPARLHRGDAAHGAGRRRRPRRRTRTTSRRAGLTLPLSYAFEPGRAHRRRHRRRAGRRAAPGRPHAVHLAGARPARGAGHGADQDAAQAAAAALRARTRPRPCRARRAAARPGDRSRCSTAWSASWAGCAA